MAAIANAQPLPQGWIKEGMIVRCMAPVGLMRVKHVHDDGDVDAMRPRSSRLDVFKGEAKLFHPATIEEYITFHLATVQVNNCYHPKPYGEDEHQYGVRFRERLMTDQIELLKSHGGFEKVELAENPAIVVTVPQSWLDELVKVDPVTPAVAARALAETDLILQQAAATPPNQRPTPVEADSAVVDWFMRMFTAQGVDMTDVKIAPTHRLNRAMGQDPTYALIWPNTDAFHAAIKAGLYDASKELRLGDYFANDVKIIVDLPANWSPTFGEIVADNPITESVVAAMQTSAPEDEDLSETARLIADLRERNERLQIRNEALAEQVDSLIAHFDAQDLRAEDAAEAAEADMPAAVGTRYISSVCKQVKTERNAQDGTIEKYLNDGWDILHIEFNDRTDVNIVFVRELPAPVVPTSARTAYRSFTPVGPQVVVEPATPAPIPPALQVETPAVNFGTNIAPALVHERATLSAMMNDLEITHEEFCLMVNTSRVPDVDKAAYIRQSKQMRCPRRDDLRVRSPFANRPDILIGDAAPGYELPPRQEPPIGMNAEERIELRMDQLRGSAQQYVAQRVGVQS